VLLVDDIQFLAGGRHPDRVLSTFNALTTRKNRRAEQRLPAARDSCPRRTVAPRFEWGLTADIQSPDLETKVAILKRKAEIEAVPLPDVTSRCTSRARSSRTSASSKDK
jgi:chromosomal replication initiator protein